MCNSKCEGKMCIASLISKILLIVGGINWGLVGVAMLLGKGVEAWNVVNLLLGTWPKVEAIVYLLVGIAAVVSIFGCRCKKCAGECCPTDSSSDASKTV